MPVIYYNIDEQKSLEKEPYKSLTKRFKNLKNALEEKEIELSIGTDKEGFSKGFYTDFEFTMTCYNKVVTICPKVIK